MATATAPVRQVRRRKRPPAFEQFFAFRRLNPPATPPPIAFTHDSEAILFATDISGQFNIWRISRSGGTPKQLTTFEDEGRGFTRRANQLRAFRLSADRLERHLQR
jgi:hypothetical protein